MARLWLYYNYGPEVNAVSGGTRGAPQLATQVKRIFFLQKLAISGKFRNPPPYLRVEGTIYGLEVLFMVWR